MDSFFSQAFGKATFEKNGIIVTSTASATATSNISEGAAVPIPTFPLFKTVNISAAEELLISNAFVAEVFPLDTISKVADGVGVPIPA